MKALAPAQDPAGDWPEGDCSRAESLATIGFVTRLSSPALMHALKGHLHNLALVAELLQKETASPRDADTLRAAASKRARTLRTEIEAMHRHVRLLESLAGWDDLPSDAFCDVHAGLAEVLETVRVAAARRSVKVRLEVTPEPTLILCKPSAFQQVILACTVYAIQRCRQGESVVIAGDDSGGVTIFDFLSGELAEATDEIDRALDLDLLGTLAAMAGARFVAQPTMRVAFRTATH